ncbi:MAG: hypothetical protein C0618_11800 [Desulfuromonas sp.]|nr:MAG: hypothetical protein C0618_11800 [Desulfuromonas sp.]
MTKKLLLADDSLTIQKVAEIIFANEDYQLLTADNGDEALAQAVDELPDLIIADVSMPGKDGFELCEAIRRTPGLEKTPVLMLPGTFEMFDEDRALSVGASGWLTKPFESQALVSKVEELLAAVPEVSAADDVSPVIADAPVVEESLQIEDEPLSDDVFSPVMDESATVDEPFAVTPVDSADAGDDDIWDAVSFDDEDMLGVATEDAVSENAAAPADDFSDVSAEIDAPPLMDPVVEEEPVSDVLQLDDEDITELSDDAPADFTSNTSQDDAFSAAAFGTAFEEEPVNADPAPAVDADSLETEVSDFFDEDAFAEEPQPMSSVFPAVEPLDAATQEVAIPEDEFVVEHEAQDVKEPTVPAAVSPEEVEEKLSQLSEKDLEEIVERVAGPLIEKLAGKMLERIAWEVVPDMAENIILEEIRHIKDGAA